jgi:hypothetical protein
MKYIGYILFALIFIALAVTQGAKDFFNESYKLAPEITILVSVAYLYIVALTIVLSLFPRIVEDRIALYDNHVKMACSVMVSLGLVGTFLGLVDMISGIAVALSGQEEDFSKKMASLLTAISTSLGAMSFAFMTSILGVGISAYSLVASTFISTDFSEALKKETPSTLLMPAPKEEINPLKNDSIIEPLFERIAEPILERLDKIEKKQLTIDFSTIAHSPLMERITELEDKLATINLEKFKEEITPLMVLETINQHQTVLEKHNELLTNSIVQLNLNHIALVSAIGDATTSMEEKNKNDKVQNELIRALTISLDDNRNALKEVDEAIEQISDKSNQVIDKFKKVFD